MPYVQVQTLVDTDRRLVTKRVNEGTTETSALVVNAAALSYALTTITTALSANNFRVGELVNSTSGGTATVQDITNSTSIILSDVSGTFQNGDVILGQTTGRARTQSGAAVPRTKQINVNRILFNIHGALESKVRLEWEGTGGGANNRTIAALAGGGVFELDTYGFRANNTANSPTQNIVLTTLNWNANCHYTMFLDISKTAGYEPPYFDRNTNGGY